MIAAALDSLTGVGAAKVTSENGRYTVTPSPEQIEPLQRIISGSISKAKSPSDVTVNLRAAYGPVLVKEGWPYVLGIVALGFLLGKVL